VSFGTWLFTAFVTVVVIAYWLLPRPARPWLLLVASYIFYAWAFPPYAVLLAIITMLAWFAGNKAAEGSKRWLGIGVGGILGVLAIFKYSGMAVLTWDALARRIGLPLLPIPQIVAPLGLSFITFGIIHYFVAVYRGTKPERLRDFFLYVSFFPTVTLGPIKLYEPFDNDLNAQRRPTGDDVAYAIWRITAGLAKKLVLAETIAPFVKPLYAPKPHLQVPILLFVAVYAYGLQLYFDFAGYSDIAIGVSRLFGFKIIENFNWPYIRRNLSEFWRCWHASLTRFITQYVYIPLGGSRKGELNRARNVIIAFLASGLWHGAAWHYVAWGAWHGVGLVVHRQWMRLTDWLKVRYPALQRASEHPLGRGVAYFGGWFVTFNYVMFGWVLFALPLRSAMNTYQALADIIATNLAKVV
jgi:alginate O-acetyltransferase complex protein AlgI